MNAHHDSRVEHAFIHYFGIHDSADLREQRLKADLGLEPLDLVLFVLELEQPDGPPFEFEACDNMSNVGELLERLQAWQDLADAEARRSGELSDWVA